MMRDKILSIYTNSIDRNLNQIKSILSTLGIQDEEIGKQFKFILGQSCSILAEKWLSEKKYYKTKFAMEAIRNYPEDAIEHSIYADAITCILDDFFDEPLSDKARTLYVIEAGRLLADLFALNMENEVRRLMEKYFNKLIIIGTSEHFFYNLIESEKDGQKIKKFFEMLLDIRAIDIDLFFQLPLLKLKETSLFTKVVKSARAFRALNLLNKDFKDWQYDKEKGNRTIFTILEDRNNILKESVSLLVQKYMVELDSIRDESDITKSLHEMARREEQNITQFLDKLEA